MGKSIIILELRRLEKRLEDRQLSLNMQPDALDFLADVGFDPVYGARPLKRTIQRELEMVIAQGILGGRFKDGDRIVVNVRNERINVEKDVGWSTATAEQQQEGGGGGGTTGEERTISNMNGAFT